MTECPAKLETYGAKLVRINLFFTIKGAKQHMKIKSSRYLRAGVNRCKGQGIAIDWLLKESPAIGEKLGEIPRI